MRCYVSRKSKDSTKKIKEEYCKSNNIYLLVIPYWDFDFINDILDETLNLHDDIV